jgi:phenylacetate-coenzyme A ligase PaaK-like adenylate-forming protein
MPLIRYSIGDLGSIGNARCQYSGLRTLRIKGRKANCIDNNGEGLLMEEDICNAVFKDQNVLQFSLRFVKNGVSQIQVVRVDDGIADSSALQNLNDLGIKKINIKYVKNLSGNYADKLQYISIH